MRNTLITAAIGGLLALGTVANLATAAAAEDPDAEKCYGVAKAGKNDCAGAAHAGLRAGFEFPT